MMSESSVSSRAAVLGSPISHSKSPLLHDAAYRHLGVDIGYSRIDVDGERLEQFLSHAGNLPGWVGWSVTMPLKAEMVRHMTSVSHRVQTLGVLNTVVISSAAGGEPALHGENTDVDGIVEALREKDIAQDDTKGMTFAVLGAGGTSAAALAAAAELNCTEAAIYARNEERAAAIQPLAERLGLRLRVRPLSALGEDLRAGLLRVVVSTLPPGAADALVTQLPTVHPDGPVLLDAAYEPWPSALALAWSQRGWPVTSGLHMLLHQAVRQVELFTQSSLNPSALQDHADRSVMVDKMRHAIGLHEGAEALDS